MRITQQLALMLLTVISSIVFTAHSIPHEGSDADTPALFGRGDTTNYYVIYPKDTQNKDQASAIYTLLKGLVPDAKEIFNSTTDNGSQHWFWSVKLTSANAEKVKGNSNVRTSSCSSSKSARTDESRSLQSFKNAHRIVLIQQKAMTSPAPNQNAQPIVSTT